MMKDTISSYVMASLAAICVAMITADLPIFHMAQSLDAERIALANVITDLGLAAYPIVISAVGVLALWLAARKAQGYGRIALLRLRHCAVFFLGNVALSGICVWLLKNVIGRARPSNPLREGILDFAPMTFSSAWASFPSGHTTTAMAMAMALCVMFPRLKIGFIAWGLAIGLSRVFVGAHWFSDVMAGVLFGTVFTILYSKAFFAAKHPPLSKSVYERALRSFRIL